MKGAAYVNEKLERDGILMSNFERKLLREHFTAVRFGSITILAALLAGSFYGFATKPKEAKVHH